LIFSEISLFYEFLGNIEISDLVWQTCKYSSLSGITKNLNTLISLGTQGDASNITVLSENDVSKAEKLFLSHKFWPFWLALAGPQLFLVKIIAKKILV